MAAQRFHVVGSRVFAVIGIAIALVSYAAWARLDRTKHPSAIELAAPSGLLRVEVAATPQARSSGFSGRRTPAGDGLLLHWDAPGRHPIWMADMRFPLDLVWLNSEGHVVAVAVNVPPCAIQPCELHEPPGSETSTAVLELAAGSATRHGLKVGTIVRRRESPASSR
jgi:uncharacterized membrane protein (UPF0127 family)